MVTGGVFYMPKIDTQNFKIKEEKEIANSADFIKIWSNMICSTEELLQTLKSPNGKFLNETEEKQEVKIITENVERLKAYQEVLKKVVDVVKKNGNWTPVTYLKIEYYGQSIAEKNKYIDLLLEFLKDIVPEINENGNSDFVVDKIIYSDKCLLKNNTFEIEMLYVAPKDKTDVLSNLWKQYLKTIQSRFEYLLEY